MSFERDPYDGSFFGSSTGASSRRNTDDNQVQADKYDASKRPKRGSKKKLAEASNDFTEENDKDRYLITYADLITLLLGLFIIMYAISTVDLEKYKVTASAFGDVFGSSRPMVGFEKKLQIPIIQKKTLKQNLQKVVSSSQSQNSVQLIENERGITIRILDDILFASGSADLSPESYGILSSLAKILKEIPNDIRIEGHTDNLPINSSLFPSNWHLSVQRATNTAYYLMNNEGLSPDKVSIVGYSEYQPIADNNTTEGRQANRRVDIIILNK